MIHMRPHPQHLHMYTTHPAPTHVHHSTSTYTCTPLHQHLHMYTTPPAPTHVHHSTSTYMDLETRHLSAICQHHLVQCTELYSVYMYIIHSQIWCHIVPIHYTHQCNLLPHVHVVHLHLHLAPFLHQCQRCLLQVCAMPAYMYGFFDVL